MDGAQLALENGNAGFIDGLALQRDGSSVNFLARVRVRVWFSSGGKGLILWATI
jgi:hypothetical protein